MVRIAISVEGLTEERFVEKSLVKHYSHLGVYITPVSLGGNVSIARVSNEMERLAYSFDYVTSLYDFYGFKDKQLNETKLLLEQRIKAAIKPELSHKVFPNIQVYEFEALLFSSPDTIGNILGSKEYGVWAQGVLDQFQGNPEKINDSPATAPSKRLLANTNYKKTIHGPDIALEIGLPLLRAKCAGFSDWINVIELLA